MKINSFFFIYYQQCAVFISAPYNFSKNYATPGQGNFSVDGVHPSSQGCKDENDIHLYH